MAKIFDREEAVRTLTLVKPILGDLIACMAELRELEAHPDTDENTLRIRSAELNSEINRYIRDLEEIGCYVSSTDELVVRFPALRGHRFGFYELKNDSGELSDWTPAHGTTVEQGLTTSRRDGPIV